MDATKRILNRIVHACAWVTPETAIERISRIADDYNACGVWHAPYTTTLRTERNDDAQTN